jgi:hypothetical protein
MKLSPIYTIATTAEFHSAMIAVNGADYRFEGPSDAFKVLGRRVKRTFQIQLEDASLGSMTNDYASRFRESQNIVANPKLFLVCYAEEGNGGRTRANIRQLENDIAEISGFLGKTGFLVHCYRNEEEPIIQQKKARRSSSESRTA